MANLYKSPEKLRPIKSKKPHSRVVFYVGIDLSFQSVSRQVLSAQVSLTAVFGMGTGGPSPQSTPTYFLSKKKVSKENICFFSPYRLFLQVSVLFNFGDPCGNRTHVCGVRGRRLDHLTNGPCPLSRGALHLQN